MKLNKKAIGFAAALVLCVQSAAVALAQPVYNGSAGTVSIGATDTDGLTGTEYSVLIVPDNADLSALNSEDILYIFQSQSPAQAFVDMGVKGGSLAPGTYKMLLGADQSDTPNEFTFSVSTTKPEAVEGAVPDAWSEKFTEDQADYYNYGCTGIIKNYNSSDVKEFGIKMAYQKDSLWYSATVPFTLDITVDGGSDVQFGFRVNNVPAEYKDSFESKPYVVLNGEEGE